MKKLVFMFVAIAAISFASCAQQAPKAETTDAVDTTEVVDTLAPADTAAVDTAAQQ